MSLHRNISHTIITRVQVTLLLIIQSAAFTRLLGIEGRGLFAKLQASLNLFILLLGFGITAGITNYIANKRATTEEVLSLSFCVWLTSLLIMFGVLSLFGIAPAVDIVFPNGYQNLFFKFYFFACFSMITLQMTCGAAMIGRQKFAFGNWTELVSTALRTLVFGALLLLPHEVIHSLPLTQLFLIDLAIVVFKTGLYLNGFIREFGWRLKLQLKNLNFGILHFSLWIYVSALIGFLYLRVDYWLVEHQLGLSELGIYSVASGLAQYMTIVPVALATVMVPVVSDASSTTLPPHSLAHFSRLNITATAICTLILMLLATPIINLLYGAEFLGAANILRLLAPSFFFLSVKFLFTNYNSSQGLVKRNLPPEILGLCVGISMNVILLPRIGIIGACWASLAANFSACAWVFAQLLRQKDIQFRKLLWVNFADVRGLAASLFSKRNA